MNHIYRTSTTLALMGFAYIFGMAYDHHNPVARLLLVIAWAFIISGVLFSIFTKPPEEKRAKS